MTKEKIKKMYELMFNNGEKDYRYIAETFKTEMEEEYRIEPSEYELEQIFKKMIEISDTEKRKEIIKVIENVMMTLGITIRDIDEEEIFAKSGEIIVLDYSGDIREAFMDKVEIKCQESIDSKNKRNEYQLKKGDIIKAKSENYLLKVEEIKNLYYINAKFVTGENTIIPYFEFENIATEEEKENFLKVEKEAKEAELEVEKAREKAYKLHNECLSKTKR